MITDKSGTEDSPKKADWRNSVPVVFVDEIVFGICTTKQRQKDVQEHRTMKTKIFLKNIPVIQNPSGNHVTDDFAER